MGVSGLTGILSRYAPNSIRIISSSSLTRQTIAVDASCHLNKFIYGDDPHYQRHIHGFYQLARFFDMNNIKPIFVFDGPSRLKAKQSEHEKREQTREKTRYSLLFQKEQLLRMENWMEVSNQCHQANYSPTKESIITILTELGEKVDQIESRLPSVDNEKIDSIDKQQIIENKLTSTAQKLRSALEAVKDTNHYTKTVRDLAKREKSLILEMLLNSSSNTQFSLDMLKRDNQAMLASLEKRSYCVTQGMREECQEFLKALGYVAIICNNHEAEAMCAHLTKVGRATAIISEDLDTLAFGDAPLLRYFYTRNRPILSIDPVIARNDLGISRESFIDFCILCGTDFSGTIQGIGPRRALDAIKKYGSIENILKNLNPRYKPQKNFDYKLARQAFRNLPPIPLDDHVYEPSIPSETQINEILRHYDIDPIEAETKVRTTMIQQNIIDPCTWGTNPFSASSPSISI